LVENRRFKPTSPLWRPPALKVTSLECRRHLYRHKTRVWRCLCDPTFSHLCTTPTCDGQTDGRTDTRWQLIPR